MEDGEHGELPRLADGCGHLAELRLGRDGTVVSLHLGRGLELAEERVELELGEEPPQGRRVAPVEASALEVEGYVHVVLQRDQLPRQIRLLLVLSEVLLERLLLDLLEVRIDP